MAPGNWGAIKMRVLGIVALGAALSGCAEYDRPPLSPEERAAVLGAVLTRPQPQPYVLPMPAPVQPIQQTAPRMCQSTVNGQVINTICY
jgi:hypothetical protein